MSPDLDRYSFSPSLVRRRAIKSQIHLKRLLASSYNFLALFLQILFQVNSSLILRTFYDVFLREKKCCEKKSCKSILSLPFLWFFGKRNLTSRPTFYRLWISSLFPFLDNSSHSRFTCSSSSSTVVLLKTGLSMHFFPEFESEQQGVSSFPMLDKKRAQTFKWRSQNCEVKNRKLNWT